MGAHQRFVLSLERYFSELLLGLVAILSRDFWLYWESHGFSSQTLIGIWELCHERCISAVHPKDGYRIEFCVFRMHDFYVEGLRLTLGWSVMGQSSLSTIITISFLLSGHGRL